MRQSLYWELTNIFKELKIAIFLNQDANETKKCFYIFILSNSDT